VHYHNLYDGQPYLGLKGKGFALIGMLAEWKDGLFMITE
jgi:hypothetical protein